MQYHENVKLSTRDREEYTSHEKLGFYSGGDEIEEILDGSPTSVTFASHRSAHFFGLSFLVEFRRDRDIE